MTARSIIAASLIGLAAVACGPRDDPAYPAGTWVGTITTEGNVTTVVNESGSLWGGTATLVEETSIGVDAGEDEYMLGSIYSMYVAGERIYVVDDQVPIVRVYDLDGNFIRNLGRRGQGPGEYRNPSLVSADAGGRVFLLDTNLARINVYAPDGEARAPWHVPGAMSLGLPMYPIADEAVSLPISERVDDARNTWRWGLQPVGPDGPYGEPTWIPLIDYERTEFEVPSGRSVATPFSPSYTFSPTPGGGFVVGVSDRYRFEIHHADGSVIEVEKHGEPVPVSAEQKEWERRRALAFQRQYNDPGTTWDGAGMPDHKPAFFILITTFSGEVWVVRDEPSVRVTDCVEDPLGEPVAASRDRPCWTEARTIDVFGADGRYLGDLDLPAGIKLDGSLLSIDTPRVVAVVQDEAGTVMVKRYRLVLPEQAK
jgi:hypothetical protein